MPSTRSPPLQTQRLRPILVERVQPLGVARRGLFMAMTDQETTLTQWLSRWDDKRSRRALIGGTAGFAALMGAGGVLVARNGLPWSRKAAANQTAGAPAPTPVPGIKTWSSTAKAKTIDHLELPLYMAIPSIQVDAPVVAVGLTNDGSMDVPKRAGDIGWFEYSPRPGLRGNSIVAGHLDWQGSPGVFQKLASAKSGDAVIVRGADGVGHKYGVEWLREFPADGASPRVVFEPLVAYGLTLITCGGKWNPVSRRYDTRIVVRALRK